jgi:hypothetical protein
VIGPVAGKNDRIVVRSWSLVPGLSCLLSVTLRRGDGSIQDQEFTFTLGSSGSSQDNSFTVGSGEILSVLAMPFGTGYDESDVLLQATLQRGSILNQLSVFVFFRDYLRSREPICWPGSRIVSVPELPDFHRSFPVVTPPVGLNWSFLNSQHSIMEINSISFVLSTSTIVASRLVRIIHRSNAAVMMDVHSNILHVANFTFTYTFSHLGSTFTQQGSRIVAPIPLIRLGPGDEILSDVNNFQSGDAFTNISLYGARAVREFPQS